MVKRIIFDLFSMFLCCSAFLCLCEAGRAQSANDIFAKAYVYYRQGEYEAARKLFQLGADKDLGTLSKDIIAKAAYYLAESEMQIGDRNLPTDYFKDAYGVKEKSAAEARTTQYAYLYDNARGNYESVIQFSPNSVEGIDSVAKAVIAERKSKESFCTATKLEALNTKSFGGKSLADLKSCTCDEIDGLTCPPGFL